MLLFFYVSFDLFLLSGSSLSDQVYQVPEHIIKKPGESATIKCSHSIPSYDRVLWYKQSTQLQFLGHMYKDMENPEAGLNVKLGGNADKGQNCTLMLEALSPNSSAVYFCAARYHSAANHCSSKQVYCQDVIQEPKISWGFETKSAEMKCSHKISLIVRCTGTDSVQGRP
ncbi:hypothetical protein ATANTOWER_032599 [Ataeniobius toweri]|uniref:Ig-like domain-containing protein n=1 Tax=Ataeniobius toweri TaxID=208326 RepID=A0ABU7C8F0_9TELE|nr:hypothetical protein [Ataeniobius toweri]